MGFSVRQGRRAFPAASAVSSEGQPDSEAVERYPAGLSAGAESHSEVIFMFGLPMTTVVIIFGIPALWVLYTLVFVFLSRRWSAEDIDDPGAASASGSVTGTDPTAGPDRSVGPENGGRP